MAEANSRLSWLPAGEPEGWLETLVSLFADFCGDSPRRA